MPHAARYAGKPPQAAKDCEFDSVALLLQGGGALGAYQAGVYEALEEAGVAPDWVGGISIGGINGAIIAGNRPEERVAKLRGFWEYLSGSALSQLGALTPFLQTGGIYARSFWNHLSAGASLFGGVPGFFTPHPLPPWFSPPGTPLATSFYDTGGLRRTLGRFIDFDVLNKGPVRFTTSAVNVRTGNYTIFDNRAQMIAPEHIMASGALPPALPFVEIDGQQYWDGGIVSNTPLEWVMNDARRDTLIFQVDLWSARGEIPKDMPEVMTRHKEIQYSSRTRAITEEFRREQKLRHTFAALYDRLPAELKSSAEAKILHEAADINVYNIVHLIYRARHYEGFSKDYEFSRVSMEEHWKSGYNDAVRTLRRKEVLRRPDCPEGIMIYDVA